MSCILNIGFCMLRVLQHRYAQYLVARKPRVYLGYGNAGRTVLLARDFGRPICGAQGSIHPSRRIRINSCRSSGINSLNKSQANKVEGSRIARFISPVAVAEAEQIIHRQCAALLFPRNIDRTGCHLLSRHVAFRSQRLRSAVRLFVP